MIVIKIEEFDEVGFNFFYPFIAILCTSVLGAVVYCVSLVVVGELEFPLSPGLATSSLMSCCILQFSFSFPWGFDHFISVLLFVFHLVLICRSVNLFFLWLH
jgi:hypothetical protein